MAISTAGSPDGIVNAAAFMAPNVFPWTLAAWVMPISSTISDSRLAVTFGGVSGGVANVHFGVNSASQWTMVANDGATFDRAVGGTVTNGQWAFCIMRGRSASSRDLTVVQSDGAITTITSAVSKTMSSTATIELGPAFNTVTYAWVGNIAEFWYTNTDIQADGGTLSPALARQLAFGGPFSVPHVAANLIEYRALREAGVNDNINVEAYWGRSAEPSNWTVTGTAGPAPHPPLPYWYVNPEQVLRPLVI